MVSKNQLLTVLTLRLGSVIPTLKFCRFRIWTHLWNTVSIKSYLAKVAALILIVSLVCRCLVSLGDLISLQSHCSNLAHQRKCQVKNHLKPKLRRDSNRPGWWRLNATSKISGNQTTSATQTQPMSSSLTSRQSKPPTIRNSSTRTHFSDSLTNVKTKRQGFPSWVLTIVNRKRRTRSSLDSRIWRRLS